MSTTVRTLDRRSLESWQLGLVLVMFVAGYLSIAVSQIALGLALVLFLVRLGRREIGLPRTGLERVALALAAWALVTIPFSGDPGQSAVYYRRFYLFTAIWTVASVADDERRRLGLVWALMLGAAGISLYSQIKLLALGGSLFRSRLDDFFNPMTGGALLMMPPLVALGFLLERGVSPRLKIALGAASLPVLLGLAQTMTRSALLGFVAGLAVVLLASRPRWFLWAALAVTVGVAGLATVGDGLLPENLSRRFAPEYFLSGRNTEARLEMWRGGWQIMKANPLVGVGDRDLQSVGPEYYGDEGTVYHGHLHSNLAQMGAIWGVPGLLLGTAFLLAPGWVLWRRRSAAQTGGTAALAWNAGALGVWAAFFVAGLTEWYFGDAEAVLVYLGILGVGLGAMRRR